MKTLYMDCFCGMSGDMIVGALIDIGADFEMMREAIRALPLEGVTIAAETVSKHGIQATQFIVSVDPDAKQPHRHLKHIVDIIENAEIPEVVKSKTVAAFVLLGEAEAKVHGVSLEKVHFHEVGAADSIVDMLAANLALHSLGIERVISSPLVTGSGVVECQHGVMPVPAPATALLLQNIPWESGDVRMELVTPTGAALAKQWAEDFMAMPTMEIQAIGYGAGTRDLPDRANVLRVFIGEEHPQMPLQETVSIIETCIDDMSPELTALLIPALLNVGAHDAYLTPIIGKKGRSGLCVTALCTPDKKSSVVHEMFRQSGTLGIRARDEKRWVLDREMRAVETPWGRIAVKVGFLNGREHTAAPEFEACRYAAEKHGIAAKRVYDAALAAANKGEFIS